MQSIKVKSKLAECSDFGIVLIVELLQCVQIALAVVVSQQELGASGWMYADGGVEEFR